MGDDLVSEVDHLVGRLTEFHRKNGREIARFLRRARKGQAAMAELERLGLAPTPELRALYGHWNGADPGDRMSKWESNVFFDFDWNSGQQIVSVVELNRRLSYRPHRRTTWLSHRTEPGAAMAVAMSLMPGDPLYGRVRLENAFGRRAYVAFDDPVAMLRTMVEAAEAGMISYDGEGRIAPWADQVARLAKKLNPNANFWDHVLDGSVDWDPLSEEEISETVALERAWMSGDRSVRLPRRILSAAYLGAKSI